MSKVLLIKSSMIKEGSYSNGAAELFVKYYKEANPSDEIIILDLNIDPVGKEVLTNENFSTFWANADKYIDQLKGVDKVIVGSPMTNFNYTATLKNYLDHVLVAGKAFKYKYDGSGKSEGLMNHLKVQIINSQGAPKGWYPFGDHTTSLKGTFEFMGAKVVEPIVIAGVKTSEWIDKGYESNMARFEKEIKEKANKF